MAKILRDLLEAKEPIFSLSLRQLENASGGSASDVRLVGEIARKLRLATVALGLDPDDTTGRELYGAQLARMAYDNQRVAKLLGGADPDDIALMSPLIIKFVQKPEISSNCWVLRRSVAKKILKTMPPKKLMSHLGHRSVDGLLKHENIDELYVGLRFSEGDKWLRQHNQLLKTVRASDFETRPVSCLLLDYEKYANLTASFVSSKYHNVAHSKELGVVALLPTLATRQRGFTLVGLPMMLHYINEIRLYSSFFKLKQVAPHFGELVVETLNDDSAIASQMAGQNVHWRIVHRHFANNVGQANYPEAFEPHVHSDDVIWDRVEATLSGFDKEMKFWQELDYVGKLFDGTPLSFNLMDVSLNYSQNRSFKDRNFSYFRESLWNEIFASYMSVKVLEKQVMEKLTAQLINPDDII